MEYDLIVVGGGIAGASLAQRMAKNGAHVLVLEQETEFRDRIRGECLQPWGVGEARKLGVAEVLHGCANEMRWVDFIINGQHAMTRDFLATPPHASGLWAFYHPSAPERKCAAARWRSTLPAEISRKSKFLKRREPLKWKRDLLQSARAAILRCAPNSASRLSAGRSRCYSLESGSRTWPPTWIRRLRTSRTSSPAARWRPCFPSQSPRHVRISVSIHRTVSGCRATLTFRAFARSSSVPRVAPFLWATHSRPGHWHRLNVLTFGSTSLIATEWRWLAMRPPRTTLPGDRGSRWPCAMRGSSRTSCSPTRIGQSLASALRSVTTNITGSSAW